MKASQVANALAELAAQRPEFDRPVLEALTKLYKATVLKAPTLELLRVVRRSTNEAFAVWFVQQLTVAELDKILKKIDSVGFAALATGLAKQSHLTALMAGQIEPAAKAVKAGKTSKATMPTDEILRLPDREQRRIELEKLSLPQLKSAMKKHEVYGSSLSAKPSKRELIEHIQAALDAGWPRPQSVLDGSRY